MHPSNTEGKVHPPAATGIPAVQSPGAWSTGLFGCCSDVSGCCLTCWCPCITFGRIAEIVDQGSSSCGASGALYALFTFFIGGSCLYSCLYRSRMRQQYMLPERPCADCLVHYCCESCALCQEYRELKHRGYDLVAWKSCETKSWVGNGSYCSTRNGSMKRMKINYFGLCSSADCVLVDEP